MQTDNRKTFEHYVAETARRLRLIQIDFADDSDEMRAECLHGEIERSLDKLSPDQRSTFLEKLLILFPIPCRETSLTSDLPQPEQSEIGTEQLKDPEFLIHHLQTLFSASSSEEKANLSRRLNEAGLLPPVAAASDGCPDLIPTVISALQLGDQADIKPDRVATLMSLFTDFVLKLEPLVWNTWRTLAPRSSIRPKDNLKSTTGHFVCADTDISDQSVQQELQVLQRLIVALITAIGRIGKQFGKQHLARFSPSEIAALVQMESGSVFVSQEVRCWRKYSELAETLTDDTIDLELRKAITDYTESLMKGLNR